MRPQARLRPVLFKARRVGFDYCVDSVNGLDGNPGTQAKPFQTIAKLNTVLRDGKRIGLARGSYWREQLSANSYSYVSIAAYGSGQMPTLDASNIAINANFSKSAGLTNVWQYSQPHTMNGAYNFSVWENGIRLIRATSSANCDATPGSFWQGAGPDSTISSPATIMVQASDSSDITANGKTYEISNRNYGVTFGPNCSVDHVHTKYNGNNDGSIVGGLYALVTFCLVEDGTKHNMLIHSGVVEDTIGWKGENRGTIGASSLFVTNYDNANGLTATYRRCRAIGPSIGNVNSVGFFHHRNVSGNYTSLTYEDCSAYNLGTGIDSGQVLSMTFTRPEMTGCVTGIGLSVTSVNGVTVTEPLFLGDTAVLPMTRAIYAASGLGGGALTISDYRGVMTSTAGAHVWIAGSGALTMSYSTLAERDKTGVVHTGVRVDVGSAALDHLIFDALNEAGHFAAGVTVTSDNNDYNPSTMDYTWNATTYADIASYKTASGLDGASITTNPSLTDPVNGDFSAGGVSGYGTRVNTFRGTDWATLIAALPSY